MLVLLLPILFGFAGLAIDVGNIYLTHSRLQAAVDAGALAGSLKLPYDPDLTNGQVRQAVENMVSRNFQNATVSKVAEGSEVRSVCVTASAESQVMFMDALSAFLGNAPAISKNVEARACAGFNNLEIALVIDVTGSMSGTPMDRTKQAAAELVDLVLPDSGAPSTKVGIVSFRGKVHIGSNVDGLPNGCRNADGTLNTGLLDMYKSPVYRYPSWYPLRVTSDTCSDIPVTQALSSSKTELMSAISGMSADGVWSGTVISEGIKWGRHVLTPEAPYTEGSDEEDFRKIMILLTDGDTEDGNCGGSYAVGYTPNNYWTNAYYGMGETNCKCNDGGCLNQAMLTEAQAAKDAGIEIFTIRYGYSDYVDQNLMKAIASSKEGTNDHYYDAPSVEDIDDIFKEIGTQLGWRLLN